MEKTDRNNALKTHHRRVLRDLTERSQKLLGETWDIWEADPHSETIREKFYLLEQNLDYVNRFCREKL